MLRRRIRQAVRNWINDLLNEDLSAANNPENIHFAGGEGFIKMPSKIDGGNFLYLGLGSVIGQYSWIGAFKEYQRQRFEPKIFIGNNVSIGNFACITAIDEVNIGDDCLISEHVYISDHAHGFDPSNKKSFVQQDLTSKGKVFIGKSCFLGYRVSILAGVHIGNYCVVGSHSVVNRSFPDYSMIAGSPARVIKKYSLELGSWI